MSKLERDFESVVAAVNAELAEAARLVGEAVAISRKAGITTLNELSLYEDEEYLEEEGGEGEEEGAVEETADEDPTLAFAAGVDWSELFVELDGAGWATSAFYCSWF